MLLIKLSLLIAVAALLAGCASYGHKAFAPMFEVNPTYDLHAVEVDDYGVFWNRAAAQATLDAVEQRAAHGNVIVLLFVHGWHHNAKPDDKNLEDFRKTLDALSQTLDQAPYRDARVELGVGKDVKVIGLYVGWRGRSLPGPLDYLTFWGRKAAAQRVGEGDLREYMLRLQNIYASQRANSGRFIGLVTVGHSFGGQVLLKAVAGKIENDLIQHGHALSGVPAQAAAKADPIEGIGDMAVLINPALEAQQFERIDQLYRSFSYDARQTPVLLVVSGQGDSARQIAFPAGRALGRWLGARAYMAPERRGRWDKALGEYAPHVTHDLRTSDSGSDVSNDAYAGNAIQNVDFTKRLTIGNASLMPRAGWNIANSPVLVAYSSEKLIESHNGIFTESFRKFLIDYVAFIEGKRMVIRAEESRKASSHAIAH